MLRIQCFVFNVLAENTYVIYDDDTKVCAFVDPGCYERDEQETLDTFIKDCALQVTHLINTHAHIDHIVGNHHVQITYNVPLALHHQEVPTLQAAIHYARDYGFAAYKPIQAEKILASGDTILLGNTSLLVLHVPGLSPGHIALFNKMAKVCFAGDVLFRHSIGSTDLPGGDNALLLQSIHQEIFPLGDEVIIYPGHGPST